MWTRYSRDLNLFIKMWPVLRSSKVGHSCLKIQKSVNIKIFTQTVYYILDTSNIFIFSIYLFSEEVFTNYETYETVMIQLLHQSNFSISFIFLWSDYEVKFVGEASEQLVYLFYIGSTFELRASSKLRVEGWNSGQVQHSERTPDSRWNGPSHCK